MVYTKLCYKNELFNIITVNKTEGEGQRKSQETSFLRKPGNTEIKNLVKKFQFSEVLRGQNVNGNKDLSFLFLGLFFLK